MNIFQRLNEVKRKVSYVQKDKEVSQGQRGSYRAVTHDQVSAHTRQHFIDCGVMVIPVEISSITSATGMTTSSGTPFIRFEAKYRVDFVNIDTPDDRVSIEYTAHALDQGDKAPGKAHSYAMKYAILKILQLETGEEDEGRMASEVAPKVSESVVEKHLKAVADAKNTKELELVWKAAVAECNSVGDGAAYATIKDATVARKKELQNATAQS